jgi:L-alanine-DL-glutamate epimerase-like enolase superfamily enzyme
MAIAVSVHAQELTAEGFDAVQQKLGEEPPEGVLVRTAGPVEGGGFRVFSVWESKEHYERFREERLLPAIREAVGEDAAQAPSDAEIYELHEIYIKVPESSS